MAQFQSELTDISNEILGVILLRREIDLDVYISKQFNKYSNSGSVISFTDFSKKVDRIYKLTRRELKAIYMPYEIQSDVNLDFNVYESVVEDISQLNKTTPNFNDNELWYKYSQGVELVKNGAYKRYLDMIKEYNRRVSEL